MAFRCTFIGVNNTKTEHSRAHGATRDAKALHALFADTFSDINATLLLDDGATLTDMRAALDTSLGQATEDDVVSYALPGHGTRGHHVVAYDNRRRFSGRHLVANGRTGGTIFDPARRARFYVL